MSRLVVMLRCLAIVNFVALAAVVLPRTCIAACHEWLGLGPYPSGPIAGYLARSTSLWFAVFGVFLWFVSRDVVRYWFVISFVGWAMLIQGVAMIGIDWNERLPLWWILAEGPSCMALGGLMLILNRTHAPSAGTSGRKSEIRMSKSETNSKG